MVEPVFLALTSTPSIAPSSAEVTCPDSVWACAVTTPRRLRAQDWRRLKRLGFSWGFPSEVEVQHWRRTLIAHIPLRIVRRCNLGFSVARGISQRFAARIVGGAGYAVVPFSLRRNERGRRSAERRTSLLSTPAGKSARFANWPWRVRPDAGSPASRRSTAAFAIVSGETTTRLRAALRAGHSRPYVSELLAAGS